MGDATGSVGSTGRRGARLSLAAALIVVAACGLGISVVENPTTATVEVDEEGDTGPVLLVTSAEFAVSGSTETDDREYDLDEADTAVVRAPVERKFDIEDRTRFYVSVEPDDDRQATLSMRVLINDQERFDQTATLIRGDPMIFVFRSRSN